MHNKTLKIGFIGGGINSAVGVTHKISSQMDERWKLVSGCFSRDNEVNISTADSWGVNRDRTYSTWQDFILHEKNEIDAVTILTPTPSHKKIVCAAIEQGYPVICEKALATSSFEAEQIQQSVDKYTGFLAVTYNYSAYPMIRELREIIADGKLGILNQIHIEMPQEGFSRISKNGEKPKPQIWRLTDHNISGTSLDLGVHLHHMIHFLSNEKPLEVVAVNNNFGLIKNIVDNTMCIARYSGNLDCQIWFGKSALGHSNGLRVRAYGSKGSAEWYQMQPETLTLHNERGNKSILDRSSVDVEISNQLRYNRFKPGHPTGFIEAFSNLYYDLADSLIEYKKTGTINSPWVHTAEIAKEGLLMLEAIAESANSKCWVKIRSNTS